MYGVAYVYIFLFHREFFFVWVVLVLFFPSHLIDFLVQIQSLLLVGFNTGLSKSHLCVWHPQHKQNISRKPDQSWRDTYRCQERQH